MLLTETTTHELLVDLSSLQSKIGKNEILEALTDLIDHYLQIELVGLFLFSQDSQSAIIKAGAGKLGKMMVARKHTISLDKSSELFVPALHGEIRVLDGWSGKIFGCILPVNIEQHTEIQLHMIQQEEIFNSQNASPYESAQLPDPRWEIIVPLCKEKSVIGALYLQIMDANRFILTDCLYLQRLAYKISGMM
jgi:hypothetical protein